jgi:glycolate oxidase FAD binding subunit
MRLTIELEARPEGGWRAAIPGMGAVAVAEAASEDQACHSVIAQTLSLLDDPEDVVFVSGDREWVVKPDAAHAKSERVRPTSTEEVVEAVRAWPRLQIAGRRTNSVWRMPTETLPQLELRRLRGIVQHDVADQVVVVRAGTGLEELNEELAKAGQCVPIGHLPLPVPVGSVGGAIALNLPHLREGQVGTWRDWIVGMTVVMADGTIVKGGSKAVKNVAGYDVQKLFIGARGTLGVMTEVILRTFPLKALPAPQVLSRGTLGPFSLLIQRVPPKMFEAAFTQYDDAMGEPATGTIWANLGQEREPVRFEGDWVLRSLAGPNNLRIDDPTTQRLMRRAKDLFDPTHKFNPGEMGF